MIKLNDNLKIDLPKLIDSRLLVQANSGGGKSWLLRRLLEQSHGKVQQIIIDLEGEFSTLREKYDYILCGKGGDTPASPKSAGLLARKILELNVSAIIDLYELHQADRKRFVRLFLESMINAPKDLWHPVMVVIDEAHIFAPEKGESEAMEAVIDLATRGRKRGYCAVLATQRLSKLHKDAAAECNNKLIGRTGLDIDMKRAADELGFNSKEQYLSLRHLNPGEFFAFGPAISLEVIKTTVGEVATTHYKPGSRIAAQVSPPTDKIKALLGKLGDIPKEAEAEAKTIQELKWELKTMRSQLRKPQVDEKSISRAIGQAEQRMEREFERERAEWKRSIGGYVKTIEQIGTLAKKAFEGKLFTPHPVSHKIKMPNGSLFHFDKVPTHEVLRGARPVVNVVKVKELPGGEVEYEDVKITGGALRMLKVLVSRYPIKLTRSQLATFAKLSPRSGTYGTYMSKLTSSGLINIEGDSISASDAGISYVGEEPNPPASPEEVIEMWRGNLGGGARRIFDTLVDNYPNPLSKVEIGEMTGLSPGSGTFGTYLSMLRSNGLVDTNSKGIKLSDNLFI